MNSRSSIDSRGLDPGYVLRAEYEVTAAEAAEMVRAGRAVIVDVRTGPEVEFARVAGAQHVPLDEIERRADDVEAEGGRVVLTLCHHGVRSLKAALALRQLGHPGTKSIAGGIEAWSLVVDRSVPRYERSGGVITAV